MLLARYVMHLRTILSTSKRRALLSDRYRLSNLVWTSVPFGGFSTCFARILELNNASISHLKNQYSPFLVVLARVRSSAVVPWECNIFGDSFEIGQTSYLVLNNVIVPNSNKCVIVIILLSLASSFFVSFLLSGESFSFSNSLISSFGSCSDRKQPTYPHKRSYYDLWETSVQKTNLKTFSKNNNIV